MPRGCGRGGRRLGGLVLACLASTCVAAPGAAPAVQHAPSTLPGPQLRLVLGPHASMVYEARRLAAPLPEISDAAAAAAPSLGLEFKSPARSVGPRAALRVQLSADAALQFRPRRGGLAVSYRAEF